MEDIFKVFEPSKVKELIEEMFTGYISSPMIAPGYVGDMYELKKMITIAATEYENRQSEITAKQD